MISTTYSHLLYNKIINQASLADIYSDGNECLAFDSFHSLNILKVNDFNVVDASKRLSSKVLADDVDDLLGILFAILDSLTTESETL